MEQLNEFKQVGKKKLRMGYTTGSCAAAAAKAAAMILFSGVKRERVELMTPKGILLDLPVEDITVSEGSVSCAVRKSAGDDPDVTDGILVYAQLFLRDQNSARNAGKTRERVWIDGGTGVGRVTKKGLDQPVGAAAINRVPREMIREAVTAVCEEQEYRGCVDVVISIPAGKELAKKTFNPHLGIEGGISVLGTSGIVEPMSETARIESIRVEMKMLAENAKGYLLLCPGNYGVDFSRRAWPALFEEGDEIPHMKFGNYVGETMDFVLETGWKGILIVAHIGKFVKVAGGIMNTHSAHADARMEILAAAAVQSGATASIARKILECPTTDAGIDFLLQTDDDLCESAMQVILEKALMYLRRHVKVEPEELEIGLVLFSNQYGMLACSENTMDLLKKISQ